LTKSDIHPMITPDFKENNGLVEHVCNYRDGRKAVQSKKR
jgi:hypothetical protein